MFDNILGIVPRSGYSVASARLEDLGYIRFMSLFTICISMVRFGGVGLILYKTYRYYFISFSSE